jgi:hypothetical protein
MQRRRGSWFTKPKLLVGSLQPKHADRTVRRYASRWSGPGFNPAQPGRPSMPSLPLSRLREVYRYFIHVRSTEPQNGHRDVLFNAGKFGCSHECTEPPTPQPCACDLNGPSFQGPPVGREQTSVPAAVPITGQRKLSATRSFYGVLLWK